MIKTVVSFNIEERVVWGVVELYGLSIKLTCAIDSLTTNCADKPSSDWKTKIDQLQMELLF